MLPGLILALALAPPESGSDAAPSSEVEIHPVEIVGHELPLREPAEPTQPIYVPASLATPRVSVPALPDLRVHLGIDVPILLGFTATWAITEGFKSKIAPQTCRWCSAVPAEQSIAEALTWPSPDVAALTSDITAYGVIPALSLTFTLVSIAKQGEWRRVHEDLVVALEATAVSAALTNVVKFASARRRPYAAHADHPISFEADSDQNLSFPSGHTSFAFALATSFATVATLRHRKLAPVLWGVGVPLAGFVGYLRLAGDRHWLGDVSMGAGLGTLVGVGLPWLLHHPRTGVLPPGVRKRVAKLSIAPSPRGLAIAARF